MNRKHSTKNPPKVKLDEANNAFLENKDIAQIDDIERDNLDQNIT
jgi:hypothetical protein